MSGPFHAGSGEMRDHAAVLSRAAADATVELRDSRIEAEAAEPGYPGEAAAPFAAMIAAMERADHALVERVEAAAAGVVSAAGAFDEQDAENARRLGPGWAG